MKPIDQRVIASTPEEPGDCLSACVASLLDLSLEDVPVFVAQPNWHSAMSQWLEGRGLALVFLQFQAGSWPWIPPNDLPLIVGGASPRGPWGHAVIGIWRGQGAMEVLHDPHPSRAGLVGDPTRVYLLVPRPKAPTAAKARAFTEVESTDLPSHVEAYVLASTPGFLARKLREDPQVHELARRPAEELANSLEAILDGADALFHADKSRRAWLDVDQAALAYTLLVALLVHEDPTAESMARNPRILSRLDWASEICERVRPA